MTLKYESEILFDLMKRDGDDAPSDVLPYESELKEKYLQQVEGAYPKLMDYRPEWLYYNLNAHLPADFPVKTLSNVTRATVDNVVPYAYGSAILKGNTLVNLFDRNSMTLEGLTYTFDNGVYTVTTTKEWCKLKFTANLVQNKKYFIMLSTSINDVSIFYRNSSNEATKICSGEQCPFIFTNPIDNISNVTIEFPTKVIQGTISHPMFIEYQDGMENWDIPYFEGMQSVQMPVLTTTGKNLFNPSWEKDYNKSYPFKLKNGTTLTLSTKDSVPSLGGNLLFTTVSGKEKWFSIDKGATKSKTTLNEDINQVKNLLEGTIEYQLEIGSVATSYEPYKSNILTVNEEVELRGIGDVKDELNLLTGEVVERIGEIVLDGSQTLQPHSTVQGDTLMIKISDTSISFKQNSNLQESWNFSDMICDKELIAETPKWNVNEWNEGYNIALISSASSNTYNINSFVLAIRKSYFNVQSIDEFKTWLTQNPLTIQYKLAKESIKTVDLTVTDQDGNTESIIRPIEGTMHVSTSSQTLPPLLDMSVPVEATTQNLMSFVNIGEEEK